MSPFSIIFSLAVFEMREKEHLRINDYLLLDINLSKEEKSIQSAVVVLYRDLSPSVICNILAAWSAVNEQ